MTFPDERDQGLEQLLRTALHGEAESVTPGGDGLARIQQRVNARRARRMWLRPLAAVGAVAIVGGAGFGAYALTRPPQHSDSVVSASPPASSQPSVTPSPTPTKSTAVTEAFPAAGMFPYTSAAAEANALSWATDPGQVALHFAHDFAGVSGIDLILSTAVSGDAGDVTLGRSFNGSGQLAVTVVHLVKFDKLWIVTGASDPKNVLTIATPTSGARVTSPVTVSGPDYGADESLELTVRSLHSAGALATEHVSFGSDGNSWSAKLSVPALTDPVAGVVAYETSAADGGPQRLAVTGVRFGASAVQAAGYPRYFYGVKNGRVAQFASRDGAAIRYLTPVTPGGGASEPQLVRDRVDYIAGSGTCANAVMSVPATGGRPTTVATPAAGYVASSFGVSADAKTIAVFETACQQVGNQPQGLLVSTVLGTNTSHTIAFPSFPPVILGNPSWEADDLHIDAVLQTGNSAGPVRWSAFTASSESDSTASQCTQPTTGLPQDLQLDSGGAMWLAQQDGNAISVVRCTGQTMTTAFSVAISGTPAELAVTPDGQAVLLSDINGNVWRWTSGSPAPTKLTPSVQLTAVSW